MGSQNDSLFKLVLSPKEAQRLPDLNTSEYYGEIVGLAKSQAKL